MDLIIIFLNLQDRIVEDPLKGIVHYFTMSILKEQLNAVNGHHDGVSISF